MFSIVFATIAFSASDLQYRRRADTFQTVSFTLDEANKVRRLKILFIFWWVPFFSVVSIVYWAIQRSWFARVNALCNLSRKKSREVAAHFRADF